MTGPFLQFSLFILLRFSTLYLKKRPTFDLLYNLDIHDLITIIFVTKKVRNQIMLCFPTSPI